MRKTLYLTLGKALEGLCRILMLRSKLLTFFSVVAAVWLPHNLSKTKISYSHSLEHYIILFAVHQCPHIPLVLLGLVSYCQSTEH